MNYRRITFARFSFILFVGYALLCQSCDTEGNLDPDYKNHFVRFFGDEGNQEGVDMIVEESDRSVILLGT
ncbi:MAG TPA: hypothetical protein VFW11_05450, partial [Cyclobacteriaceae bacterium]|nr:hypothetical protein [Cyclobacteriaceae bacterium]